MKTEIGLADVTWSVDRAGALLGLLAGLIGTRNRSRSILPPHGGNEATAEQLDLWFSANAPSTGVEVISRTVSRAALASVLTRATAMILRIPVEGTWKLLGLKGGRRRISVVTPCGSVRRLEPRDLIRIIDSPQPLVSDQVEVLLDQLGLRGVRKERARRALMETHGHDAEVGTAWLIKRDGHRSIWALMQERRIGLHLAANATAYVLHYGAVVAAWAVIGRWALAGSFDQSSFLQWLLLLLTMVALGLYGRWSEGIIALRTNGLIKERLLRGAMNLNPDAARLEGPSHLLGRVLEANTLQTAVLEGYSAMTIGTIEAAFAAAILLQGAAGGSHLLLLLVCIGALAAVHWTSYRRRLSWAGQRVELTHALAENMVGFRTRLVQQAPRDWHMGEDESLLAYHRTARAVDRAAISVELIAARGWMIAASALLLPPILQGAGPIKIAISIGGILLAESALVRYLHAGTAIADGAVAWRCIEDIIRAAAREETPPPHVPMVPVSAEHALMICRDLRFTYENRPRAIIERCGFQIDSGDRVVLEGDSGSGKSTLCALITGARIPDSGLILLHGLDRSTVGPRLWRRRTVLTMQFNENHIFTESLAFNLLMGRRWPPKTGDLQLAHEVCTELGLEPLISRMPGGLFQVVGEYGWQLSHGERSRVFIARALLQEPDLVVLDETLGALDATTFERCLDVVTRRARTVVVVAHP